MALHLRTLTSEELTVIRKTARSRTEPARAVERAKIILLAHQGKAVPKIARALGICSATVRMWIKRFNEQGLEGLQDRPRSGRPPQYTVEQVSQVIAAARTEPQSLGLPFSSWTLDRLQAYLNEEKGIPIKRTRIAELLEVEGLHWRRQETWFTPPADPEFAERRERIISLYTSPPENSVVLCLDEMGPIAARSYPGRRLIPEPEEGQGRERARQEADYGRRGKGYIFGALIPASGKAFTEGYERRTSANFVDFLGKVDQWLPSDVPKVYGILDNLSTHHTQAVRLFVASHPRWELVYQPKYAPYLNLLEPWWKVLDSLGLDGRRFEDWEEIRQSAQRATDYWDAHCHPFVWGHRRRHRARRRRSKK